MPQSYGGRTGGLVPSFESMSFGVPPGVPPGVPLASGPASALGAGNSSNASSLMPPPVPVPAGPGMSVGSMPIPRSGFLGAERPPNLDMSGSSIGGGEGGPRSSHNRYSTATPSPTVSPGASVSPSSRTTQQRAERGSGSADKLSTSALARHSGVLSSSPLRAVSPVIGSGGSGHPGRLNRDRLGSRGSADENGSGE